MVGVAVPDEVPLTEDVDASVNVHSAAFFAAMAEASFLRRSGRAAVFAGAVAKTFETG